MWARTVGKVVKYGYGVMEVEMLKTGGEKWWGEEKMSTQAFIPPKCIACGMPLDYDLHDRFLQLQQSGVAPEEIWKQLGLSRPCCRSEVNSPRRRLNPENIPSPMVTGSTKIVNGTIVHDGPRQQSYELRTPQNTKPRFIRVYNTSLTQ
jgi:DNA-directed RNA polymerase subunit N (RpoN/RPB10)